MKFNEANKFGPLSEAEVEEFEKRIGVPLPADYRAYLLRYHGGIPSPSFFWLDEDKEEGSDVFRMYGLKDADDPLLAWEDCRPWLPKDALPIGDDGVGNTICLMLRGQRRGSVLFVDHEEFPGLESGSLEGVTDLGASFEEFLSSLTEPPGEGETPLNLPLIVELLRQNGMVVDPDLEKRAKNWRKRRAE